MHALLGDGDRWFWRSFLTGGASAAYLFLYSAIYFAFNLSISGAVPALLFFAYMFLVCAALFALAGSVGYLAALCFVSRIYATVKID